jgi:heme-degrading monooxygenase HmoA
MFARSVSLHLKPNRVEEFTRIVENEVISMMRSLRGFQDKIVLVASGGLEAISLSIWDLKEDAEAYRRDREIGMVESASEIGLTRRLGEEEYCKNRAQDGGESGRAGADGRPPGVLR